MTPLARRCWLLVACLVCQGAARGQQAAPEGEDFFFTPKGFSQAGSAVWAAPGAKSGRVRILVTDASTGQPAFCRLNVIGADGNYYQPRSDYLSPYALTGEWPRPNAWGNRKEKAPYRYVGRFFYSWGQAAVDVPPGSVRVEAWKGLEYAPQAVQVTVHEGATVEVKLVLERRAPLRDLGWYSGDPHLHIARSTNRDDDLILDLLEAEDVGFGSILGYNEPAGPYAGFMQRLHSPQYRGMGAKSIVQRGDYWLMSGQEYRNATYGHLLLFGRDDILFPGADFNADNWPVFGLVAQETRKLGGHAIYAHGGYRQEIYADAALGLIDGVELLQFGIYREIGLEDWYHILNSGWKLPCVGASDWPACRTLADCRTYVRLGEDAGFPQWLKGMARGQSFVTTGPLLLLEVDGRAPGDQLELAGPEPRTVTCRLRAACLVTRLEHVDLVVNGQLAARFNWQRDGRPLAEGSAWREFETSLKLAESAWIAARAWSTTPGGRPDAEAHTNPVYVHLNGRAPYQPASLDQWVERIDGQIARHRQRDFPEKARVLDYFQKARDFLLSVRERGGLRTGDNPALLAGELLAGRNPPRLETDAGLADVSDDELREFLKPVPPRSAQQAILAMEPAAGFTVQCVAEEPLVYDPVAAAFDEEGNLYVCELRDYPFKPQAGARPQGAVRLLKDSDGDGQFDASTVFADNLLWAAGVVVWKGGVFVAAPPDIWYFKDTDGDGRADERRRLFTGFGTENQQAMLNNLVLGIDGWIYGSTAGNGGKVASLDNPDLPAVDVFGRDFRFHPATGQFEAITGTMQFGNTFDDWGNRFLCSESQPLWHVVLPAHYLARNPYLPVPGAMQNAAPGPVPIQRISPVERWRQIRSARRIARNERPAGAAGASHHVIDAAAGVTVYRGHAYPPEYYGTVFVADGQNNLVHHRVLLPDGVTFRSERAQRQAEFLRSSDVWFRPVNFVHAPDGTLYCLDLAREILESIHIPLDVARHLDLASGREYGRIYRIAPAGFKPPAPPRLPRATTAELVALLEHDGCWWRETAQRLLLEREDASALPALRRVARQGRTAQSRVLALWTLEWFNALRAGDVLLALRHEHPGVRENAIRLAEPHLANWPEVRQQLCAMANDPHPRVRFQLAFTLGAWPLGPDWRPALTALARRDAADPWMRAAILSAPPRFAWRLLADLLGDEQFVKSPAGLSMIDQLAMLVGVGNDPAEVGALLERLATEDRLHAAGLPGRAALMLGRGLKRTGARLPDDPASPRAGPRLVHELLDGAAAQARDPDLAEPARVTAVELLGCGPLARAEPVLAGLLGAETLGALQSASLKALADYDSPRVAEIILDHWRILAPEARAEAVTALLAREPRVVAYLQAALRDEATVSEIDPTRRELLLNHKNPEIRDLAARALGNARGGPRGPIVEKYRQALSKLEGSVEPGRQVFARVCAGCHRLGDTGHALAPSLASSAARDRDALLLHILDPNQYVLPQYVQYVVLDRFGRTATGMIASQTATSITLAREKSATETMLRADIEELASTGKSLMPEGLENQIPPADMAHLLAFLQQAVAEESAGNPHRERDFGTLPGLVEPRKNGPP